MNCTDIRSCYAHERDDAEIAASILDTRPPYWLGYKKSSGMDCLIMVLRRIYSHTMLGPDVSASLGWIEESEADNPILGHAWHMFGEEPDEVKKATTDRQEVEAKLLTKGIKGNATFEELSGSSLMNETFWSQEVFRLTQTPFCINEGHAIEQTVDEIANMSLLRFDRRNNPNLSLQEVVDKAFGIQSYKGRDVCFVPSQPWIIRVLYEPNTGVEATWPLSEYNSLRVPIWDEAEDEPTVCFEEIDRSEYCLLAVVRLKHDSKPDLVRTYSSSGANIVAQYEPSTFISSDWSATEPTGAYMLFFGLRVDDIGLTNTANFPEVAECQEVDHDLVSGVHDLLKTERAKIREAKKVLEEGGQTDPSATLGTHRQETEPDDHHAVSQPEASTRKPLPTQDQVWDADAEAKRSEKRDKKRRKGKKRGPATAEHN
ncbi:hypothetical protein ACHAQD_006992 [Fusarium lateritium]